MLVYGKGEAGFENVHLNVPKHRHNHIIAKFSTSVEIGIALLSSKQIFDICPPKFVNHFQFCVTIKANGTKNFKPP